MTLASAFFNGKSGMAMACLSLALASGASRSSSLVSERERDPFQPQAAPCAMSASPNQWRLQGLIGDTSRWVGWVKQAENGWLRVRYDEAITQTEGLKARLDQAHGTLRLFPSEVDCPVSEIPLSSSFPDWSQGAVP
ncbi:HofP DNA utilization family protein [Lonsdalea quercina]|uniref:HofP DNA utilization family protein n=1 Tax=Lonsdalea quercina TaxID=71657 RepID=UPI00068FFE99|nr:HofP DNA utilization family protein [Lonsdalea quercina]